MVMTVFSALTHPTLDLDTRCIRLSSRSSSSSTVNSSIENKHTHTSLRVPESLWLCGVIRVCECVSVCVPPCVCDAAATTTTIRRCRQWCKRFQNHKQTVTILMQTLSVWKKKEERRRERERIRTHERKFVFVILVSDKLYVQNI